MATTTASKKYIEAIGRRKEAIARVRVTLGGTKPSFIVNDKPLDEFFPQKELQVVAREALMKVEKGNAVVTAQVKGGGIRAQAEAIRLGTARALVADDREHRTALKPAGYLKRDPRIVERKKFGLKKARKSPQWAKR
jgi:small subunit ribosomal protein S9